MEVKRGAQSSAPRVKAATLALRASCGGLLKRFAFRAGNGRNPGPGIDFVRFKPKGLPVAGAVRGDEFRAGFFPKIL
jgi:hypothetical protein